MILSDKFLFNEIKDIVLDLKKRRINLNLSQLKLAKLSNLSQSIINKLENGKIDPSLSTIIKIDKTLSNQEKLSNLSAKNIMTKDILSVNLNNSIAEVIDLMLKKDYSQVLVLKNKRYIGVLYEHSILQIVSKKIDIYSISINNYIESLPIIVPEDYPVFDLSFIFANKRTKFILVGNLNEIEGIITRSDLFK